MCLGVRRLEIKSRKSPENKGKNEIAIFHDLKDAVKRRLFLFCKNLRELCNRCSITYILFKNK